MHRFFAQSPKSRARALRKAYTIFDPQLFSKIYNVKLCEIINKIVLKMIVLLQFLNILFLYKLCVTEERSYVHKLKTGFFVSAH